MAISFYFLCLAFLAEIIGTVGGFGSSVFFVPVANFYFDFETVLGMTALFHVFSNLSKITQFKKGLDKKLILYLGVPSVVAVVLAGFASNYVSSLYLEILLGFGLVSLSLVFLIFKNLKIYAGKKQAITGGIISGAMAGLLGTGGAVRGITMAAFNLPKDAFIATSAMIDFFVDFSRTIVYFYNGYISSQVWSYLPFLLFIGWFGTYAGKQILKRVNESQFKSFALILILLVGALTLIKALGQLS